MNDKKLIVDYLSFEVNKEMVNEAVKSNGPFIVKGVLQRADAKNQNNRVYPLQVLMREAKKYEEEFVKDRRALGELDHAATEVVNLKNVSHNIIEMHWEDNNLVGTVEVLSTPSGNILRKLFECGIKLGISSRGLGSTRKIAESVDEVQDDYALICFDFVSNPSTRGAFMFSDANALQESVSKTNNTTDEWEKVESLIRDILEEIK
jgi:hypothetical protein